LQATPERLARFAHIEDPKRRTFSAMMAAMDEAVGAVMGKVRALGQEDNTLVVFLADNGGPTMSTTSRNGPLRGFKATTWEGGVRVPFCMQWKGVIPAGTTYTNPIIQLDVLPTALAAAGATIDPSWKLDGVNLLPYLTGKDAGKPHEALYWRFGEQWAIRQGDWKLVVARGGSGRPELYNLADDIGESKDLASSRSEIVKELRMSYDRWNAEQAPSLVPNENGARKKAATAKKSAVARKEARKAARKKAEAPPSD
jgi:arylsulfatase A-like enzyme